MAVAHDSGCRMQQSLIAFLPSSALTSTVNTHTLHCLLCLALPSRWLQDARELDELLDFLCSHQHCSEAVLLGHSTGCQDIVTYLASHTAKHRATVKAAILQVSTPACTTLRL